jgi:hypothetical protein
MSSSKLWGLSFSDLTDELLRKRGDAYLMSHPDPTNNYYDLVENKFISFVNSFNIDKSVLDSLSRAPNASNPVHYLIIQWQIACLQMLVCQNNMGLNDVHNGIQDDVYYAKYKMYRDELISLQSQIRYETIVTGTLQQNQYRSGNTFRIMW